MRRDELDWADTEVTSLAIDDVGLQPEVDQSLFLPFEPVNAY
jgi:hypothetical protein